MTSPPEIPVFERENGGFLLSTDSAKLDMEVVRGFLARSYWANTRSREVTERAMARSLCFGIYRTGSAEPYGHVDGAGRLESNCEQIGFARVVTDYATFAWLCDVFVVEEFRGQGLGKWLVDSVLSHPDLQGLRRWMLATGDAHGLYKQFGFVDLMAPERWMERFSP
jgi:GNAT superfamily N-acetyltransferase